MRRTIRVFAVVALLGLGIAKGLTKGSPKNHVKAPTTHYHGYELNRQAINRAKSFTVLISNEGFGGVGRGTGVLIDPTHVLTCAHMLEGPEDDFWIYPYPVSIVVKGRAIFASHNDDLAILELNHPVSLDHYAIFQEMHYDGEPITIIGNTMGAMRWFVSFGIVSGDWGNYVLTDGVLYGGNSGGPWINEHGEVVALTDWTLVYKNAESGVHGGVAAKTINAFLKAWKAPSLNIILQMLGG
jgi:hypothetical protein